MISPTHAAIALLATLVLSSCAAPPARLTVRESLPAILQVKKDRAPDDTLHGLLTATLSSASTEEDRAGALGEFVKIWTETYPGRTAGRLSPPSDAPGARAYDVSFAPGGGGRFDVEYFDELTPASYYEINGLANVYASDGEGATLLGYRENRAREAIERYYPPEGISRPVTAIAQPGPTRSDVQPVEIQLVSPCTVTTVRTGGAPRPVAANWSIGWAYLLSRTTDLARSSLPAFLSPLSPRQPGFFLLQPYEPDKIPLIMVHGLFSTPLAWANLSNELWGDPAIRDRYQIWHYYYPTSAPPLYTARLLRPALDELRRTLDPTLTDPAMQRTVLITHSMGGLIGKSLVTSTGDAFWEKAFARPLDDLSITDTERATLKRAFFWEPVPHIDRVIYIAVPHRGSDFAANFIGLVGRFFAAPPVEFREFYRDIHRQDPGALTPAYAGLATGKVSSVTYLSPKNPSLLVLDSLSVSPSVTEHSIIGNRGSTAPLESTSDGVVPYPSSHLARTDSELVVPTGHDAFRHPDAVAEIKRILHLEPPLVAAAR